MSRLTDKSRLNFRNYKWCVKYDDEKVIVTTDIYNRDYAVGKAIEKLGKLEDILEKYGIESVEELDKRLMKTHNEWCCQEADRLKLEYDRDTWKKACELACSEVSCDNCPIKEDCGLCGNCIWTLSNYFYQQAKGEQGE